MFKRLTHRDSLFLTIAIPLFFLFLGVLRAYPFIDDVTPAAAAGDDWLRYKEYAQSILHDGFSIPIVKEPYKQPAGFLYNYFVASVFAVLGENSSYVYVVQSAMLGASISMMYIAFRHALSPFAGLAYALILTGFMLVDVFLYYSFKLLSENLLLFLLPVFFVLVIKSHERSSLSHAIAAGVVLGLAILTRPNVIVAAIVVTLISLRRGIRSRVPITIPFAFLAAWCGTLSVLVIRNYTVTGQLSVSAMLHTDWLTPTLRNVSSETVVSLAIFYIKRILYVVGFLPVLTGKLPTLPHWIAMWLTFCVFTVITIRKRRPLEFWEAVLYSFIAFYLSPLIAAAQITNYGIRMIVPVVPAVLLFSLRLFDMVGQRRGAGVP